MISVFLVVTGIIITLMLVYMNHREVKKQQAALFYQFSKLGTRYGLSFSSHAILPQHIVGLDGIQQKILVLELVEGSYNWQLINLKEVSACAVKKSYSSIAAGDLTQRRLDDFLEEIALEFYFKTDQPAFVLPFYIRLHNAVEEIPVLDHKAKDWEVILGKMLTKESKRA